MNDKVTVNDMMEDYALDAIDYAKDRFGVSLDYTVSSVEKVEEIAAALFSEGSGGFFSKIFRKGLSSDDVAGLSKMLGAYIGEVYRKAYGGEWSFNEDLIPGSLVIQLKNGELALFPPTKVQKRLTNGAEDNLWSYFRVVTKDSLWENEA